MIIVRGGGETEIDLNTRRGGGKRLIAIVLMWREKREKKHRSISSCPEEEGKSGKENLPYDLRSSGGYGNLKGGEQAPSFATR